MEITQRYWQKDLPTGLWIALGNKMIFSKSGEIT